MKKIKSLRTERITLEGMTEEGMGDRIVAAALPAPSPCGRAQMSGEMVIIGRDGLEFRPRGEKGDSSLRKRRRKTPHYSWTPPCRGLENSTPNPIRHRP